MQSKQRLRLTRTTGQVAQVRPRTTFGSRQRRHVAGGVRKPVRHPHRADNRRRGPTSGHLGHGHRLIRSSPGSLPPTPRSPKAMTRWRSAKGNQPAHGGRAGRAHHEQQSFPSPLTSSFSETAMRADCKGMGASWGFQEQRTTAQGRRDGTDATTTSQVGGSHFRESLRHVHARGVAEIAARGCDVVTAVAAQERDQPVGQHRWPGPAQ